MSKEEYNYIQKIYQLITSRDESCRIIGFSLMKVKFPNWYESNIPPLRTRTSSSFNTYADHRVRMYVFGMWDTGIKFRCFIDYRTMDFTDKSLIPFINKLDNLIVC